MLNNPSKLGDNWPQQQRHAQGTERILAEIQVFPSLPLLNLQLHALKQASKQANSGKCLSPKSTQKEYVPCLYHRKISKPYCKLILVEVFNLNCKPVCLPPTSPSSKGVNSGISLSRLWLLRLFPPAYLSNPSIAKSHARDDEKDHCSWIFRNNSSFN